MHRTVLAFLLTAVLASAQSSKDTASLAAKVQRLEDIEEIRALLLDYGRHLDSRDFAAYSRLFAKDGIWSGGFGTVEGPAAIQAFMEKNLPGANSGKTHHILSNFLIDVRGDAATASSRWQFVTGGTENKPTVAQSGRYDDTLVRENGRWRFKKRVASTDIPVAGSPGKAK
jgi:ketosteroid isomerase-like protein